MTHANKKRLLVNIVLLAVVASLIGFVMTRKEDTSDYTKHFMMNQSVIMQKN